jgi:hypothetical protein
MQRGIRVTSTMLIAAAALAAAAVAPASSLAGNALKLEIGGTNLVGGSPVSLTSSSVTISNSSWSLACSEVSLNGALSQNRKGKGNAIQITEGGAFGGGGNEGLCASGPEFVTTFEPEQTPELTLNTKGKALLHYTRLRLVPEADIGNNPPNQEACVVSAVTLRGTFPVTTTPAPLEVTFTSAKMKIEAKGSECGIGREGKPHLTGTFVAKSRGSTIEAQLFNPR